MRPVTKKWIALKLSSLILTPLMVWYAINLAGIYDKPFIDVIKFYDSQPSKILFTCFILFAYLFSSLSISEVFEDYISKEEIKNAANKALYLFAITCPILTIIVLFNLKI